MDCVVCTVRFNEAQNRPKVLPCGHTFCLSCLQHENIRNRCPMDRTEFSGTPKSLPDNFNILALCDMPSNVREVASGWWCRDCRLPAADGCLEKSHDVCSLRRERGRQSAGDAERLELGVRAAAALAPLLDALAAGGERLLAAPGGLLAAPRRHADGVRNQLHALKEARSAVEAALEGDDATWDAAARAAADQARLVTPLEHALWLLGDGGSANRSVLEEGAGETMAAGSCTITVARGDRTATATLPLLPPRPRQAAEPQRDSPQDMEDVRHDMDPAQLLLQYLLLVLLEGNILEVSQIAAVSSGDSEDSCTLSLAAVSNQKRKCVEKTELLETERLEKVKRIVGLRCDMDPQWSQQLLSVLRALPSQQLRELELLGVGFLHLQALRALLPGLRRLRLEDSLTSPCDRAVSFPAARRSGSNSDGGLQWLRVLLRHKGSVESLLRGNCRSLEWLELGVGVPSRTSAAWPFACENSELGAMLERCNLAALRCLVLVRDTLNHGSRRDTACHGQIQALAARFGSRPPSSSNSSSPSTSQEATPRLKVLCSKCHAELLVPQ